MEDEIVQYFIVNSELGMSPGKVAAQVAHVATLITYYECQESEKWNQWFVNDQPKIVLRGKEKELRKLMEKGAYYIKDNGRTEIPENSLTCVGFSPNYKLEMRKIVGRLQLY